MNPILSIVIANYNYGRFLEGAIRSVIEQVGESPCQVRPSDLELIVIDGGSNDNSQEIIRMYADKLAYWVSEPDKGQSDAFNKGFARARGKYLTWVNADDIMPVGCLRKIVSELKSHPECEWFTGNMFRFTEDGVVIEIAWGPHYLPRGLQSKGQPLAVFGPSTIFAKTLFESVGKMKLYQNFMMDTDLWMRFIVAGVKQRRINCFCWAFRMHAASKTAEFGDHRLSSGQRAKFEAERKQAYRETGYRPSNLNRRLIQFWRMVDGSFVRGIILRRKFKRYGV